MGPVAQSGGQLVSISEPFLDESSTGEVWVSGDLGATWTLVTSAPSLLTDVVGGPDRFVAVGVGGPGPGGDATAVIAHVAIWYSVDGYTWEPAEDQPSFAGAFATGLAEIRGRYALVGGKEGPVDGPSAVIWGSADGMTWEAAELPAGLGTIAGIDAGPDGFVAVGGTSVPWEGSTATLWRSADAITWVPSELSIVSGRANDSALALQPTDVVAGSGGILVTGFSPSVRSASSFTWLVRPQAGIGVLQDASFISDAAPREEGFVAIRICHPIQCEIPIELVFGAAAGNAPEGLAMVDRPSTAPDIDCGSLDSDTCSRVLESVYSQHEPQRVGTVVSIAVGPPICFEASCDSVEDVGSAVGVTIDFAARTWPLQLNCPLRADTDQWLCIAASRVLDGVPDLGVPYGVTTYTHCGLRAVNFDEDRWAIEGVLDDGSGNPPDGFGNPTDAGTVTLVAPDEGIYRSFYGVERRITRGGGLPPVEGCL
jgi:hypothetical protein